LTADAVIAGQVRRKPTETNIWRDYEGTKNIGNIKLINTLQFWIWANMYVHFYKE